MVIPAERRNLILTVDADSAVRGTIGRALRREGAYDVIEAQDGQTALQLAHRYRPDVVILDVALADMDGKALCAQLRRMPWVDDTAILFLSMQHNAHEIAQALDSGGDSYMHKQSVNRELVARVRALLRRAPARSRHRPVTVSLCVATRHARINGCSIDLTPTEFKLLEYLGSTPYQPCPTSQLLQGVWGCPAEQDKAVLVRNHIRNLRSKVEGAPNRPTVVVSRHGRGYALHARVRWLQSEEAG